MKRPPTDIDVNSFFSFTILISFNKRSVTDEYGNPHLPAGLFILKAWIASESLVLSDPIQKMKKGILRHSKTHFARLGNRRKIASGQRFGFLCKKKMLSKPTSYTERTNSGSARALLLSSIKRTAPSLNHPIRDAGPESASSRLVEKYPSPF